MSHIFDWILIFKKAELSFLHYLANFSCSDFPYYSFSHIVGATVQSLQKIAAWTIFHLVAPSALGYFISLCAVM